jgi:hypothetical protein
MERCDRHTGHAGQHSWELSKTADAIVTRIQRCVVEELDKIAADLGMMMVADMADHTIASVNQIVTRLRALSNGVCQISVPPLEH